APGARTVYQRGRSRLGRWNPNAMPTSRPAHPAKNRTRPMYRTAVREVARRSSPRPPTRNAGPANTGRKPKYHGIGGNWRLVTSRVQRPLNVREPTQKRRTPTAIVATPPSAAPPVDAPPDDKRAATPAGATATRKPS